ncbi:MAG: hypothetical protein QOI38_2216 [Sphingomonadales bacterium]|jgi:hypothetical protein|nr:hypothetical protein [Sphingomonadales bacterium]
MPVSEHRKNDMQMTQNQKNRMSEDPGDGARGRDGEAKGGKEPAERIPEEQSQNQGTIEAFGEEGAGIAAKE